MDTLKRNKSLLVKLGITLGILTLYRLGTLLPGPGIEAGTSTAPGNAVGTAILNMFTGGAMARMSVFALGAMPFITASIIMQLASIIFPWVAKQRKLGQDGQDKLMQITRYLTVIFAAVQSISLVWVASVRPTEVTGLASLAEMSTLTLVALAVGMTAGAVIVMRMGEIITEKGIGNGISLLIFTSIASTMPAQLIATWEGAQEQWQKWALVAGIAVLLIIVAFVEGAQRRIPVRFARQKAHSLSAGTYLPLRINQSNVIPAIFATSIIAAPAILYGWFGGDNNGWFYNNIVVPSQLPTSAPYIITMVVLVIFFAYYYTFIQHNPDEQAENIAKGNGFIPGYAPGVETSRFISKVMGRLLLLGSVYLAAVSVIPNVAMHYFADSTETNQLGYVVPFAGTGLLILVSVALTTVATFKGERLKTRTVKSVMLPEGHASSTQRLITRTLTDSRPSTAVKEK